METEHVTSKVLLVEDQLSLARTYMAYLEGKPYEVTHVELGGDAIKQLTKTSFDAVLLDLKLPDINGLEVLKYMADHGINASVVVITAHASVNVAVEAMRLGAGDFLVKPFSAERLLVTLANVLERQRLNHIVETYRESIDRNEYCGFVGGSLAMQAVYRIIDSAARSKATVFITGESGTGKELCAEAVHSQSQRAKGPFVAINCAAIPHDLMESEIFGHVKGAFTSAISERDGAASRADGGTLFLDEICEMDLDLQSKLLRFIQTGTFAKVGSSKTEKVDIRFVCATNRDPLEEVAAGRFREDLFYRLHVIPIVLPPLRDRDDDVLAVAEKLLIDFAGEEGKDFRRLSDEVSAIFTAYTWPGNIRQLQNVVRNMVVLHDGPDVTADMLPSPLDALSRSVSVSPLPVTGGGAARNTAPQDAAGQAQSMLRGADDILPLADMEREIIERAIALCDGNVPQAAAKLGISASTIYRKRTGWENSESA